MVQKQITQSDLLNLENKIKLDVSKEQQELRHGDRSKMQQYINYVDDLRTDQALTNQTLVTMTDNFQEIKNMVKGLDTKIDGLNNKFATIKQVDEISEKQTKLDDIVSGINLKIAGVSGAFAVVMFLIEKYGSK